MATRWYSNYRLEQSKDRFVQQFARVEYAKKGNESSPLKLELITQGGARTATYLEGQQHIEEFLSAIGAHEPLDLQGKVLETYWTLNGDLQGFAINPYLA